MSAPILRSAHTDQSPKDRLGVVRALLLGILVVLVGALVGVILGLTVWATLWEEQAEARVGYGDKVQRICDQLSRPVPRQVDLEDCALCHGQPFVIYNEDNLYAFGYRHKEWATFCPPPVTTTAPDHPADTP